MSENKLQATRDGFGEAMLQLGTENQQVVALCADLSDSLRLDKFKKSFPSRYVECGVAEQNMMSVGAGLALAKKIPFIASFAVFNPGRNLDQLRVATYSELNIKVVGGYAGFGNGGDGATHQAFEDLAIMSSLPKMTVLVPADAKQAHELTLLASQVEGPCYLRLGRVELEPLDKFAKIEKVSIGQAQILKKGQDLSIFATGLMVQEALKASLELEKIGMSVEVLNFHTIKPLDHQAIIKSSQKTQAVIVAAEHEINSGLTSLVAQSITQAMGREINQAVAMESIGMENSFGESAKNEDLLKKYKFNYLEIIRKAKLVLNKKKRINS